jgi:hypothetical protein
VTAPLPDPVRLDPPPGDPHALAALGARLDAAAGFLGDLGGQLAGTPAAGCGWTGADASAADAQAARVAALARDAAEALRSAAARVTRHGEVLADARRRLAQLEQAQADDYYATASRLGDVDPGTGVPGPAAAAALEELRIAETHRGRLHGTVLAEVEDDAAATAAVLAGCSVVAGGGPGQGRAQVARHLEDVLPGWHAHALRQRGAAFAAALRTAGDLVHLEQAARDLLPRAGNGAVAAEVLAGLGADGVREVLRLLGDGSLSAGSSLAGVMAAVLGAPVPTGAATEVARARDARHVDPDDVRSLDADHVALGMGMVLAAARRQGLAGPPPATVREWGRQIIVRERELGPEWITAGRPRAALARPGDPLVEVLDRLARADAGAQAAELLAGEPTWTHLLSRPWDDEGAALTAVLDRAAAEPGGDVVVRSGLRALGVGLGDDGDPAGWTVDRATATLVAPALADAVAARPDVVVEPLARAASGEGEQDRLVLRGLGYLGTDPAAATVLDRAVADAGPGGSAAGAVPAGYAAVREYGQRLVHALDEFAAQERAEDRERFTDMVTEGLGLIPKRGEVLAAVVAGVAVLADFDGTWDASADDGQHVPMADAVRAAGGTAEAEEAYRQVNGVVGNPTAPVSPGIDVSGLVSDLAPGTGRTHWDDVVQRTGEVVTEVVGD